MGRSLLIILACLALLVGGCGGSSSPGKTDPTTTAKSTANVKADSAPAQGEAGGEGTESALWISGPQAPIRYEKELKLKPSGLAGSEPKPLLLKAHRANRIVMKDLLDGIGTYAFEPARVIVQYVAYDYKTGKVFASSWDKGRPVTFTLGAGEVSPAWEEALDGMEVGDRRVVVAPPKLAQGSYPPNIPQGKTVGFILELLPRSSEAKAEPASTAKPSKEGKLQKPKVVLPQGPPPKKLVIKDLEPGSGPPARAGDELVFQYVEMDYKTGKEFDSSWDRGRPYRFTLGNHELIRGWEEGLEGMRVGGRRELIAPPLWAFEPGGVGNVPPNTTVVFVVDLLAIK